MIEFMKEHALFLGASITTVLLGIGKVAFGLGISWLWVFSPIWMLLLFAFGVMGLVIGMIGMAFVMIAGVLGVCMVMDGQLEDEMEGWSTEEEADAEVETPTGEETVDGEQG